MDAREYGIQIDNLLDRASDIILDAHDELTSEDYEELLDWVRDSLLNYFDSFGVFS